MYLMPETQEFSFQAIEGIGAKVKYVYTPVQLNGGLTCDTNVNMII